MTTIRNGSNGSKPFDPAVRECRVCIHAGKPYAECITHWVKDRSGNVTCPTLLNQKCLLCGTCGHTASYCKMNIGKPSSGSGRAATTTPTTPATTSTKPTKPAQVAQSRPASSNRYAVLGLIEQEQAHTREMFVAMFPTLPPVHETKPVITRPAAQPVQTEQPTTVTSAISWARRLSSPPPPPQHISVKCNGRDKGVSVKVSWADEAEEM